MNNILYQDSTKLINNNFSQSSAKFDIHNVWMWISIVELIAILYLLLIRQIRTAKPNTKMIFKDESMKENIDFDNVIKSSFNSTQLYNELKVKCHPDRYISREEKNIIAESLFQEITKNKTNYKKLTELKEEAIQKLNINP